MSKKGVLVVVSGFSGAGKGTLMKALLDQYDNYALSISATTRAPREGETEGREYFFKSREEFLRMIEEDALIEYAQYVGNYYGTPKDYVLGNMDAGKDVILDIEIQGAIQVCSKRPDTVRIFIAPPSWAELERRLTERGTDSPEKIQKRLLRAGELIRAGVPVMKAAEQAGFEEYSTFLRAFRGTFHMSPREFR